MVDAVIPRSMGKLGHHLTGSDPALPDINPPSLSIYNLLYKRYLFMRFTGNGYEIVLATLSLRFLVEYY